MTEHRPFWHKLPTIVTVAYFIALVTGTHWPKPNFDFGFEFADKMAHFAAYAGLAALCQLTWLTHPLRATPLRATRRRTAVILAVMLCVMGAVDELTQIPIPGRCGSVYDWAADAFGVAAGLLFFRLAWPLLQRFFGTAGRSASSAQLLAN